MSDLIRTLHNFAALFERLQVPYAIMGGWAVRMYGLPRPTTQAYMRRWAKELGVAEKLEEVLASRP